MFTGTSVRNLRTSLKLSASQMAQLLGTSVSTIYRWEKAGDGAIRVDPMQAKVLAALDQELKKRSALKTKELGETILTGLLIGGGLFALFKVLEAVYDDK